MSGFPVGRLAQRARDCLPISMEKPQTLRLRAEFEAGDTTPTPDKYLDLSYGQRALSSVN
jgi:hypothetical protein